MGFVSLKKKFDTEQYHPGASKLKIALWYLTDIWLFKSKIIPSSSILVSLLRAFGAKIGDDVRIKPGVYIKYPWRLEVGNYSWIADCYIDNLVSVKIGENCCLSQKAMLITGNHDYKRPTFNLITSAIIIEDGVWIGAGAMVCPGVTAKSHAVLSMGSVATKQLDAFTIYQGNPAIATRKRVIE